MVRKWLDERSYTYIIRNEREADRLRLASLFVCLRYKKYRHPAFHEERSDGGVLMKKRD